MERISNHIAAAQRSEMLCTLSPSKASSTDTANNTAAALEAAGAEQLENWVSLQPVCEWLPALSRRKPKMTD